MSEPLQLELQAVVRHVDAGNQAGLLCKNSGCFQPESCLQPPLNDSLKSKQFDFTNQKTLRTQTLSAGRPSVSQQVVTWRVAVNLG